MTSAGLFIKQVKLAQGKENVGRIGKKLSNYFPRNGHKTLFLTQFFPEKLRSAMIYPLYLSPFKHYSEKRRMIISQFF